MKQLKELANAIKEYQNTFGADLERAQLKYKSFFLDMRYDDLIKAEVALIGSHQSRLNDIHKQRTSAQEAIRKLAKAKLWTKTYTTFEEIYLEVEDTLEDISNIGPLTIYDTALRISMCMNVSSDFVYLNAGAAEGARNLFGEKKVEMKIDITRFSKILVGLNYIHIENFLCIYKKIIVKHSIRKDSTFPKYNPKNCCGLRRNLLAYKILELQEVNVVSSVMTISY